MDGSSSSSVEAPKRSYSIRQGAAISRVKQQVPPKVATRNEFDPAFHMFGQNQVEKFHQKLIWVTDQWQAELKKLEQVIGSEEFTKLLQVLDGETSPELVDLRDRAYALKEILASRPMQDVLHSKVKRMSTWDATSRSILDTVRPHQQSDNLMSARKQSAIYYTWAITSAARASTFVASMYATSKVLTGLSVTCTAAVPLLAIFHTVTMIRDVYRTEESFYKERANAYAAMDQALGFMKNIDSPSLEDAGGALRFLDACKKIPELSQTAELEADKTYYAAMRERYFLPVNLLSSAVAQILNSLRASPIGGTVLFGLSGLAYLGQAYCDWKQGDAEKQKAEDLRVFAQQWIDSLNDEQLKTWRAEDPENVLLCDVLSHHMERILGQQGLEVAGGIAREIKAGANLISGGGSMAVAATLQLLPRLKPAPANIVGTFISTVSTTYMTFTATKMYRRGDAIVDSKHRREDARLLEAMLNQEDINEMMADRNRQLVLRVPVGIYDEHAGFPIMGREVSPATNEHLAVGVIARKLARITDPKRPQPENWSLISVLQYGWKMPVIELWAMTMIANGMQDDQRRLEFLRHRLAPLFKTDYPLKNDIQRAAPLPAPVLVDQAIDALPMRQARGQGKGANAKKAESPESLYRALTKEGFFKKFNEDDFVVAVNEVWSQRRERAGASDAKTKLSQVKSVADHILELREQSAVDITKKMRDSDAAKLSSTFADHEVRAFREQLRLYLNAQIQSDLKGRASAALSLSRMPLVQRLILDSRPTAPEGTLLSRLECSDDLQPILACLDIDRAVENDDDSDDIITLSDSDESESDDDAGNDRGNANGNGDTVIDVGRIMKAQPGDSNTDSKVSTEDSDSDGSGTEPVFTPRRRGRLVERIFTKQAHRREKLMAAFENVVKKTEKVDSAEWEGRVADADQSHMEDRY